MVLAQLDVLASLVITECQDAMYVHQLVSVHNAKALM